MSHRIAQRTGIAGLASACILLFAGCRAAVPGTTPGSQPAAVGTTVSKHAIDNIAEAHAHYCSGFIHELEDEQDEALSEFYTATVDDPADEAMGIDVARRFIQAKQPGKAAEILKRSASRPNASGEVYAQLGVVLAQLGRDEEAIAANRAAARKSPLLLTSYQALYLIYAQKKDLRDAAEILDEAGRQADAGAEFLIGLSDLYVNLGLQSPDLKKSANEKALEALRRADKLQPANPALKLQMAESFNSLGDSQRAAELYLDLLKKLPDIPTIRERVHARLTDIYLRSEDRKRAAEQLQAIIREDPTNPQAYYFLGSLALQDQSLGDAADYFRKTILLNPDFEQAYYDLALAQLNSHQAPEALDTLRQARQKFTPSFRLNFLEGMASSATKDYAAAVRAFTAAELLARASDPARLNEFFYFQFGAACERVGNYEDAEKDFHKCLQMDPNFSEALNYLGFMWADHGTKLDDAKSLIEKAVKLEPKNSAYLDSLGWVLFKQKNFSEALAWARKAVESSPEPDPTVLDHLGDIYAGLHQPAEARAAWQKSLSLEPNDEVRKKLNSVAPAAK
ncbi:MAG TPA: tetratricopeptide repeat protein [Verrucomicrobiae bacterium]|nr:tetratricopeptide repeat protein [Verrucomicrobiae bacterium]